TTPLSFLIHLPPTPTLFPYTTLFRSSAHSAHRLAGCIGDRYIDGAQRLWQVIGDQCAIRRIGREVFAGAKPVLAAVDNVAICGRSEEPRLNSSHDQISYAVFCLKKKN